VRRWQKSLACSLNICGLPNPFGRGSERLSCASSVRASKHVAVQFDPRYQAGCTQGASVYVK
jgi:hypothetical protein